MELVRRAAWFLPLVLMLGAQDPPPLGQEGPGVQFTLQDPEEEEETSDRVSVPQVDESFLQRLQQLEESRNWRVLFDQYRVECERNRREQRCVRVKRSEGGKSYEQYVGVVEYLQERLSKMPIEALEAHRMTVDPPARNALERATASGSPEDLRALEEGIEATFFSSSTDEAIDFLASRYFEEGRVSEALYYWDRLLRLYPDSELPKSVTVGRMAVACREGRFATQLDELIGRVQRGEIPQEDAIIAAGGSVGLMDFLSTLKKEIAGETPVASAAPPAGPGTGPGSEVLLQWVYDFSNEDVPEQLKSRQGLDSSHFIVPAFGRIDEKEYLVFTNGYRVVAVDPRRVYGDSRKDAASLLKGVYWKYPDGQSPVVDVINQSGQGSSLIGCSLEGSRSFATLFRERGKSRRDEERNDNYLGPQRIVGFDLSRSGKLLWNSDRVLFPSSGTGPEMLERTNWAFSTPPLIRGDRLYVGIHTSPSGERDSLVICFDVSAAALRARDPKPVWLTYLASASGNFNSWRETASPVGLTTITEDGGVLYVLTNIGVVGALHPVRGSIQWLHSYAPPKPERSVEPEALTRGVRPANAPLVMDDYVFFLPQDYGPLLVYDRWTGRPMTEVAEEIQSKAGDMFDWGSFKHLLRGDAHSIVLAGTSTKLVRFTEKGIAVHGMFVNSGDCGRGTLHGDRLFLSARDPVPGGQLTVISTSDWRIKFSSPWSDSIGAGNLSLTRSQVVVATDKVAVYCDRDFLDAQFNPSAKGGTLQSYLEHAELMRSNGRLDSATESFLKALELLAKETGKEEEQRRVRGEVFKLYMQRGASAGTPADACSLYQQALEFALDEASKAAVALELAKSLEKSARIPMAVRAWQDLLATAGNSLFPGGTEPFQRSLRDHAEGSLRRLIAAHGAGVYEGVEEEAAALLKWAGEDPVRLGEVLDKYPVSRAAEEARTRLLAWAEKNAPEQVPAVVGRIGLHRAEKATTLERIDSLLRIGDRERACVELERLGREQPEVAEKVAAKLKEIRSGEGAPPAGPLTQTGLLKREKTGGSGGLQVPTLRLPLQPQGVRPPKMNPGHEVFTCGSSVELWELGPDQKKIWTINHPGGYLGAGLEKADDGIRISTILRESPAEKAGLKPRMFIETLDGEKVTVETIDLALAKRSPGTRIVLGIKDAPPVTVELVAHPANVRPAVVGAAYTDDYNLVVAWEDGVASFDLSTGAIRWTFRDMKARCMIGGLAVFHGGIAIHETWSRGRWRDPMMQSNDRGYTYPALRVVALDARSGRVLWTDRIAEGWEGEGYPSSYTGNPDTIQLISSPHREDVAWLHTSSEPRRTQLGLRRGRSGESVSRLPYDQTQQDWYLDLERGIFYLIDAEWNLRGYAFQPGTAAPEVKVDHSLRKDPVAGGNGGIRVQILAEGGYLVCCLNQIVPDGGAGKNQTSLYWFSPAEPGKLEKVEFPGGRYLSSELSLVLDASGVLYVYSVDDKEGAFVTAYQLAVGVKDPLWDVPAPKNVVQNESNVGGQQLVSSGGCVALYTPRTKSDKSKAMQPRLTVLRSDTGAVEKEWAPFRPGSTAGGFLWADAGRLYVNTSEGLEVYERSAK